MIAILLALSSCHPRTHLLEPKITYTPQKRYFERLPSEFKPLSQEELETDWGKELKVGLSFAKEFDFYRAITFLKTALFLMPRSEADRRMEAEFYTIQCYYLGGKYNQAIETFESSSLSNAKSSFPAFRDLLVILYESYLKIEQCGKAEAVLSLIEKGDAETALDLKVFTAIDAGDIQCARELSDNQSYQQDITAFLSHYRNQSKSPATAQWLNALMPGAGYLYIGQKKSALTSLVLNASFTAAAYYFFNQGNWGAGLFTASLEFGWYFGGINGAGLGAKEYNECLYKNMGKNLMIERSLFPVLMLQTGF